MVTAGRAHLTGLPVASNGELLVAPGAPEAPIPMEVDPTAGLPLLGDLELASRPSYAQVAAKAWAIGPLPSVLMHQLAGIEGAIGDKALSSGWRFYSIQLC